MMAPAPERELADFRSAVAKRNGCALAVFPMDKKRICEGFDRLEAVKATSPGGVWRLWRFLPIALCFALNGCVAGNLVMEDEVRQYSGDGVIHTCSTLLAPGYAIEFPKFGAAKPYQASYRLSNVPQTSRAQAGICLRFNQPDFIMARKRKSSVTASFHLTLYDARNNVLHSAEVQLSRSGWSETNRLFSVYAAAKSYVQFERNAKYILNVSYTPGAIPPPANQLYFAIDNC